ncbi:MAG TPA: hypothetical protein VGY55_25095 [Pirellulales bacterium]|jgi:hypothetical protein|nr:hypothetical protein [Pirellulales bacterium]
MSTRFVLTAVLVLATIVSKTRACPFCNAVKPTLAQQRDAAVAAFVGEPIDKPSGYRPATQSFEIHRALKSKDLLGAGPLRLAPDLPVKEGSLVLLLGSGAADARLRDLQWTAIQLDETAYAYVVQSPDLRQPSAKRLAFFSRYLEHANRLLAEDAYLEFGHATYDQTAEAADHLAMSDLRRWLADPQVPPERKGFYSLALGFAKTDTDREQNRKLLRERIVAPANDFRAGFDGILAGYLLLDGARALKLIESRYLADPKAADGDVRGALKALRFYHDFGHGVGPRQIAAAVARVLDRPEFAAEAITDLARWDDWEFAAQVASLYERKDYADPFVRRSIVGYLKVCPLPQAAAALDRLRQLDPKGIGEAEKVLSVFTGK